MSSLNTNITTSLIISTYNWPSALNLVLKSVFNQSIQPTEVIIADDGSATETKNIIDSFKEKSKTPIMHVWHEDNGFRLSEIRNKAILKSSFDYIIQIDGDTILNKHFIKDHLSSCKKGTFISASRVLLDSTKSKNILSQGFKNISPVSFGIKNRINAIRFPLISIFIKPNNTQIDKLIYKVRGCNMSFWRSDLIEINGYNENIKGWGREDSELALRLLKKGISLKKIKFSAIQYHLYHKEVPRDKISRNEFLLNKTLLESGFKTVNGIKKR